jgi:hypothetical protein
MRIRLVLSLLCLAGAASLPAQVPVMRKVLPESGKIGSVLRVQGDFLGKTKVDEVYLTDHTFDMKVKVLDQTDDYIEFRVPPFVKPGRLQLLVKTTDKEPILLEQPVYLTIEEVEAKDEVQAKNEVQAKDEPAKEEPKVAPKETLQATAKATPPASGTK